MSDTMVYVSIAGLELKSVRHYPRFWWHAIRALIQAKRAPGLISVQVGRMGRMKYTLSVWADEAAMRAYFTSGAHANAMAAFPSMATGSTCGYMAENAPARSEIPELLRTKGKPVRTHQSVQAAGAFVPQNR
jgi:hypothetical protein